MRRRDGLSSRVLAVALVGIGLGFGTAPAFGARISVSMPSKLAPRADCVVVVGIPRTYPRRVLVLLQQRLGKNWLTRARLRSPAGHTVRLRFRPHSDTTTLVLRIVVMRGERVLLTSRVRHVFVQSGAFPASGPTVPGPTGGGGPNGGSPADSAPAVTTQPSDSTAFPGETVSFSASFSGTPATTIQWQVARSGGVFVSIPGATSSNLELSYLSAGQNGNRYRALGTNRAGEVATRIATLTVRGSTLLANQALTSSPPQGFVTTNGEFQLDMQPDGNLVLYNNYSRPMWATGTGGNPGAYVTMQGDGNLVIYGSDGQALWNSGTGGSAGVPESSLVLGNEGGLRIQAPNGTTLWQTGALDHSLVGFETLLGSASQNLTAPNQQFSLTMQTDGNLVLYNNHSRALWATNTIGHSNSYLTNQPSDGNLVVYNSSGEAVWSAGTGGNPGDSLQVQSDGNLVVYSAGGSAIWQSNTVQNVLEPDEGLLGSWTQTLTSANRSYQLVMQEDGNLVLYSQAGASLWNSGTEGHPGAHAIMQSDGNLVVYDPSGQALWSSGTGGNSANVGAALDLQNDGNVVIYTTGAQAIWATNTGGGGSPPPPGGPGTTSIGEQASKTAESLVGQASTNNPHTDGYWSGYCEVFVEVAYGNRFRYINANADYYDRLAHGLVFGGAPPRGALVFYGGGGGDGHVAVSVGNGMVASTYGYPGDRYPIKEYAYTYFPTIGNPYRGWGMPY
jgi:hypothetical protein